jgi:hypothetical protein
VEDNSWAKYGCGDQTCCQNRMGWKREILGLKQYCEEEFGMLQFKSKTNF